MTVFVQLSKYSMNLKLFANKTSWQPVNFYLSGKKYFFSVSMIYKKQFSMLTQVKFIKINVYFEIIELCCE